MGVLPNDVPLAERIRWLGKQNRLSGQIYNEADDTIWFTAGIKSVLKRYNVDVDKVYQSLDNFASITGFRPDRRKNLRFAEVKVTDIVKEVTSVGFKDSK
jgi:hypothetical protein